MKQTSDRFFWLGLFWVNIILMIGSGLTLELTWTVVHFLGAIASITIYNIKGYNK